MTDRQKMFEDFGLAGATSGITGAVGFAHVYDPARRQKMFEDLAPMADMLREMGRPIDISAVIAALEPPADMDCD